MVHNFSDVNTALLNYGSVQTRSNSTSPISYSVTKTRNYPTLHDKVTNKNNLPNVHVGKPRKSAEIDYKSVPVLVFNKWVIGIELNKCQDQFRACVNSFESSPKHLVKLMELALGEVKCDNKYYMVSQLT